MDEAAVLDDLAAALELQYRSALQYTLAAGSLAGFEYHALGTRLWDFAQADLADARRLVEKIVALGGCPGTSVAPLGSPPQADAAVDLLVDTECEAIAALHAVIPDTGQEPRSEALEHLLEHMIMRKQEQVDTLLRARRRE
jgi:bacterioferritin (cytochrome b1)